MSSSDEEPESVTEVLEILHSEHTRKSKENATYLMELVAGTAELPEPATILDLWRIYSPLYFVTTTTARGISLGDPTLMSRLVIDRTMKENPNGLVPGNVVVPGEHEFLKRIVAFCKAKGIPMQVDKPPVEKK